jgi:hypothetical protein
VETRRQFLKSATALGVTGAGDRGYWLDVTERIAGPVLDQDEP